jgi:FG-GAP-like repeat/PASTA domain
VGASSSFRSPSSSGGSDETNRRPFVPRGSCRLGRVRWGPDGWEGYVRTCVDSATSYARYGRLCRAILQPAVDVRDRPRLERGLSWRGRAVAVHDLNGDGKPDLVTANWDANDVSVLLSRGKGTFEQRRDYATGRGPNEVAVGDLNCDSAPDIITTAGSSDQMVTLPSGDVSSRTYDYVSVLLNRGDGTFDEKRDFPTGETPSAVAIADLDQDGYPDLAVGMTGGVSVLLNDHKGSFTGLAVVREDQSDELEDEGVTLEPDYVSTLRGRGDGGFVPARPFFQTGGYAEGVGAPTIVEIDYLVGGQEDGDAIAVGDLDGDSRPDLVAANFGSHKLSLFLNRPGRCTVQDVSGLTQHVVGRLSHGLTTEGAARALARGSCRVGAIRYAYSKFGDPKGRVIGQKPRFGAVLPSGSKVDLVVSKWQK